MSKIIDRVVGKEVIVREVLKIENVDPETVFQNMFTAKGQIMTTDSKDGSVAKLLNPGTVGDYLKVGSGSSLEWGPVASNPYREGTGTTVGNTTDDVITIATTSDTNYLITANASARRTDSGGDAYSAVLNGSFLNNSGTLSQTSITDSLIFSTNSSNSYFLSFVVDGTNIIIRANGEEGKTISWAVSAKVTSV